MFIASDEFKAMRKSAHMLMQELRENSIILDPDKVDEYSNDIENLLFWIDEVEEFFYGK